MNNFFLLRICYQDELTVFDILICTYLEKFDEKCYKNIMC